MRNSKVSYFNKGVTRQIRSSRLMIHAVSSPRLPDIGQRCGAFWSLQAIFAQDVEQLEKLVPEEAGLAFELLFNTQQLIIFTDTVRAAGRSRLDLAGICCHGEVCDE